MEFLGNTWWIWLLGGISFAGAGVAAHLHNMSRVHRRRAEMTEISVRVARRLELEKTLGTAKRFGFAMIFFFIAGICEVLFVIGLIVRLIDYFREIT